METLLIISITITALAVVIQACILAALYLGVKQSTARMEVLANDLHRRTVPVLDAANAILNGTRPNLEVITANLAAASATIRSQVERADTAMSDVLDRARLQVIRADELVTRTLDRVEETSELVQHTVISPVKQFSGIISGVSVGLDAFFRRRKRQAQTQPQDEELFI